MKNMSKILQEGLSRLVKEMPVAKDNDALYAEFLSMAGICKCPEDILNAEQMCKSCRTEFEGIMDKLEREREIA